MAHAHAALVNHLPSRNPGHLATEIGVRCEIAAADLTPDSFRRSPRPAARSRSWALTELEGESYTPIMAWTEDDESGTIEAVEAAIDGATDWEFYETPSGAGRHLRLLSHQVTLYWDDALTGPLAMGALRDRALVYERYALCMPEGLITAVFDTFIGTTELTEAGYVDLTEDGDAWLPSGRLSLDDAAFYQPTGHRDPWDNQSSFTWDEDSLALTEATDPLGLSVETEIMHRILHRHRHICSQIF